MSVKSEISPTYSSIFFLDIEWRSVKSVDEVGLVRKTSSAYHTERFGIEKVMPPPVRHLVGHGQC